MTAKEDRSLGSGMPIPKWMKNKISDTFLRVGYLNRIWVDVEDRRASCTASFKSNCSIERDSEVTDLQAHISKQLDFGQTAFSPTELDDSFMYYYRHQKDARKAESKALTSNLSDKIAATRLDGNNKVDFSKHPTPCQKYIHGISDTASTSTEMKIKSSGTDDGFKGEAAKCGSSIIRVASQMVSGKVVHGFDMTGEADGCEQHQERYDLQKRRGSKSLPASPLASPSSSPRGARKVVNKYFTAAYSDADKSKGGWILSNLLARREISQSVGYIHEETKEELDRASSTASVDDVASLQNKTQVFKAKASELREMNFWSPTSM